MELTDHLKPVTCLAFAPDGSLRLVSGSRDCTIKVMTIVIRFIYSLQLYPLRIITVFPLSCVLSFTFISTGGMIYQQVWDMFDDGNMFKTLREHPGSVRSVAWSPDGQFLCSTGDRQKVGSDKAKALWF